MKLHTLLLAAAFALGLISTACSDLSTDKGRPPMFWTWLDYRHGMNFDSVCTVVRETGIEAILLNAPTPDDYRTAIGIAHKHNIRIFAWLWTMNLEHDRDSILANHPEWLSVNRRGESLADTKAYVDYYKFMCPALPEVRDYIRRRITEYCKVEGLEGIAIDYHRFVDVILPTTLWPRYGVVQDREHAEWDYGYHPRLIEAFQKIHGYDPRLLDDPSADAKWLQFRCDQITEVANEIADIVHAHGKLMAASPFPTPAMSRQMVRQDWGRWNLDLVFPMVYHTFYTGDVSFIADCTIDNTEQKNPLTTLYCGLMVTQGDEMFRSMDAALNNGARGIAIFTVNSLRSPEMRARFRQYTDSVRLLRARTGASDGLSAAASSVSASSEPDPFRKPELMLAVRERIAAKAGMNDEASAAQFRLGEFIFEAEQGAAKSYLVEEMSSGKSFRVSFYYYGGILSGWNVEAV
ncbi:MAG: family 10 glycosylhydrolase [Tannerellaceae bacterium]|jgi:uncharacterized lipoprotein YddW (UPF0748 family)|nr:family 10 glycosylhydrolase [Tannerellaceae bacterium]